MNEDIVELVLSGETVLIAKEYDISIAYLQVPNAFSITIGSGATAIDLMRRYPKNTPFVLKINGVVQFMGRTDGFRRRRGEATELEIFGRDALSQLVTDEIQHDRSFNNATFEELSLAAFRGAGYDEITLFTDAAAHRKAVTGTPIVETVHVARNVVVSGDIGDGVTTQELQVVSTGEQSQQAFAVDQVNVRQGITVVATFHDIMQTRVKGYKAEKPIEWKAGQSYYAALNKELSRGGIFLRATVDPAGVDPNVFLLSEPVATQTPLFGLARLIDRDPPKNIVSVLPPMIDDSAVGRHAHYIVRSRTGGGKDGKQQIEATFTDDDMVARGYNTHRVVVDEACKTRKQAEYMARKLCAEARRTGRVFTYTLPRRHTLPLLAAPSQRAIPTPDVVVSLIDEEHGLEGDFWIERVRFRASASNGTFTDITLMVPDDLVFGEGAFYTSARKKRKVFGRTV
jgi:prophage tail gpP-like protein